MRTSNVPESAADRRRDRECWDVLWLVERPVIRGEGSGQDHLPKPDNPIHNPQPEKQLIDLQVDRVPGTHTNIAMVTNNNTLSPQKNN